MKKLFSAILILFLATGVRAQVKWESIHTGTITNGLNVVSSAKPMTSAEKDSLFKFQIRFSDTMRVVAGVIVGVGNTGGVPFTIDTANAWTAAPNFMYVSIKGDSLMNQFLPWDGTIPAATRTGIKQSGKMWYQVFLRGRGDLVKPSNGSTLADSASTKPTFEVFRETAQ